MGIVSTSEIKEGRRGSWGQDWNRTYSRSWRIITDNPLIDANYIRTHGPVSLGNTYSANGGTSTDVGAYVLGIDVSDAGNDGKDWIFTANYGPWNPDVRPNNPTERPLEVSIVQNQFEQIVDFDINGNPIVNSAGDFFEPGLTEEDSRPILNVMRWQLRFNMNTAMAYRNAVNSDVFLGRDPRTVRSYPITGERVRDPDYGWIFKVQYQFAYKPEGWTRKEIDAGMREKYTSGGSTKLKPILKNGIPVQEPVPLNGSGAALAVGGTLRTLEFHTRPELPFSVFNFSETDFEGIDW